jgi:hypothetical protein
MTGLDIFNITASLIDELLATGAVNGTTTAIYKARTPAILNLWQTENFTALFNSFEIVCVRTTPETWVKQTMPVDFKNVSQIISIGASGDYIKNTDYKWEDRNSLYVSSLFEGIIRIVYKPIPVLITSLDNVLQADAVTCMSAPYFLAAHLLLVEDSASASFFNQRYDEFKAITTIKNPSPIEDIVDVLGGDDGNNVDTGWCV